MTNIPKIFNKNSVCLHRLRSLKRDRFLFDEIAKLLAERMSDISREFASVLIIGARGGILSGYINSRNITGADLSAELADHIIKDEILPFTENSFDLVISLLDLHTINDPVGMLIQIHNILKQDGIFIGNLFGYKTLYELRTVLSEAEIEISGGLSPRISPFTDVKTMGSLLQRAGFDLPVSDSDQLVTSYDDISGLVNDLRNIGETSSLLHKGGYMSRRLLDLANKKYLEQFPDGEGGIIATFEIITLTGIKG